jgi:rieske iron-sulfur protein
MSDVRGQADEAENISDDNEPCGCAGCEDDGLSRRAVIGYGAAVAAVGGLGLPGVAQANEGPLNMPVQPGDRFMITRGKMKNTLLTADLLEAGEKPVEGFPVTPDTNEPRDVYRNNRVLMLKLETAAMDAETRGLSAGGNLVYSAICTHKGCTIKSWMKKQQHLRCHCHLSVFNPLSGGSVESGPARRQLPAVPIEIDAEGYVVAAAGWTETPGAATK